MIFRTATTDDIPAMQQLYLETIQVVCRNEYDQAQRDAWSSTVNRPERWTDMIRDQWVLLAEIENQLVGYGTLKDGDYIDFLYVHKDFQRQGIADKLLQKLEDKASEQGAEILSSDISKTARLFFEKKGFKVVAEQKHIRQNTELTNYKMYKNLPGPGLHPNLIAACNIMDTFKITGRGLILAGSMLEGNFFPGDEIEFLVVDTLWRRKIIAIEGIKNNPDNPLNVGLLIKCDNEQEIDELRAWRPCNVIARIYKGNANPS